MLEQKVADAIDVTHLHIGASKQVALLVASRYTDCDVGLKTGEFIGLRGHDTHDVALLALNAELSDCSGQVPLLVGRHRGANYQRA